MCYDASFVVFVVLKLLADLLDFQELVFYWVCQVFLVYFRIVQGIQEEQYLKSSVKEKDKEIDSLYGIVSNLDVRLDNKGNNKITELRRKSELISI
jgi:hypothetical protein